MALTDSITQSCRRCFSGHQVRIALCFEVDSGYQTTLGKRMRYNNILFAKIPKLCTRSKHNFIEKLLEVSNYGTGSITDQSKLLNKVPIVMGYNGVHGLIDDDNWKKHSGLTSAEGDDFDFALTCKRFPSIILGSSPQIKLYDETACYSETNNLLAIESYESFLLNSTSENRAQGCLNGTLASQCSASLSVPGIETSSPGEEHSFGDSTSSQSIISETRETSGDLNMVEEYSPTVSQGSQNSGELILDKCVSCIPGLSKRMSRQLENCGLHTLRKLLHHFPRTYADLQNAQIGIDDGRYFIFLGKVLSSRGIRASYSFSFLEVIVGCEIKDIESTSGYSISEDKRVKQTIYLHLKKYFRGTRFTFQPFLKSIQEKHKEGEIVCVSGKVRKMPTKDHYEMREYSIDVLENEKDLSCHDKERLYPIYPSKGRLNPDSLRDIISRAIQDLPANIDPIPETTTKEFGLLNLREAYSGIHQPKSITDADWARKRLIFDEFFYLQLGRLFQMLEGLGTQLEKDSLLDKFSKPQLNSVYMKGWSDLTKNFLKALPYSLTESQLNAVSEILWDLKRPIPMNRLLQGDVGCGKTVVAFSACMEVLGSGYQAAFMVPTELLAIQHHEHFLNLLKNMEETEIKPSVALLTGSTPVKQSRMIRQGLQTGEISLVIGTHSLISENVEFSALRLCVVDEQHRFGVIQRGRFNSKLYFNSTSSRMTSGNSDGSSKGDFQMAPHVLAMSATPIPRTLALALYGDMSLTEITDLPPGRTPVKTCTVEGTDNGFEQVYKMMWKELEEGGKVYLVYPIIEQSEQLPQLRAASADFEFISNRFKGYNCGLLHGRMKSDEKEEALRKFRNGQTQILLATQVIEIGVDVPDASMMVVMNAERFGIAQLHQLRGRVGRGVKSSKCIFIASTAGGLNRLKVLEDSSDAFHLANIDLILRGPGDLLGKKQSGHLPEFPIARLEIDGNILQEAHLAALKILGASHDLERFPGLKMELSMRQPLCLLGD